jgi:hypothetical protein
MQRETRRMRDPNPNPMQLSINNLHQRNIHEAQGLGVNAKHGQINSPIRTPAAIRHQKLNRQFRVFKDHIALHTTMPHDEPEVIKQFHDIHLGA